MGKVPAHATYDELFPLISVECRSATMSKSGEILHMVQYDDDGALIIYKKSGHKRMLSLDWVESIQKYRVTDETAFHRAGGKTGNHIPWTTDDLVRVPPLPIPTDLIGTLAKKQVLRFELRRDNERIGRLENMDEADAPGMAKLLGVTLVVHEEGKGLRVFTEGEDWAKQDVERDAVQAEEAAKLEILLDEEHRETCESPVCRDQAHWYYEEGDDEAHYIDA